MPMMFDLWWLFSYLCFVYLCCHFEQPQPWVGFVQCNSLPGVCLMWYSWVVPWVTFCSTFIVPMLSGGDILVLVEYAVDLHLREILQNDVVLQVFKLSLLGTNLIYIHLITSLISSPRSLWACSVLCSVAELLLSKAHDRRTAWVKICHVFHGYLLLLYALPSGTSVLVLSNIVESHILQFSHLSLLFSSSIFILLIWPRHIGFPYPSFYPFKKNVSF